MPLARFRDINQYYSAGYESSNATNDVADEIINNADHYLLSQQELFAAQGGYNTVALAVGAAAFGTLAVFAGVPRTAAHFRTGSLNFSEWAMLSTSALFSYNAATWVGAQTFGNPHKSHSHWMAYTFVKAQNRFEGRRILNKTPRFY